MRDALASKECELVASERGREEGKEKDKGRATRERERKRGRKREKVRTKNVLSYDPPLQVR